MCYISGFILILTTTSLFYLITGQEIPPTPCPDVFQYEKEPNGDIYGKITVPYDGGTMLELSVNASMKGFYRDNGKTGLSIKLITPDQDLINQRTDTVSYSLHFPFQHTIPKITNIELNNRRHCSGPPEKLIAGTPGVSSLWAGHRFYFDIPNKLGPVNPTFPVENTDQPQFPEDFGPVDPVPPSKTEQIPPSQAPPISQSNDNDLQPVFPSRNQNQECGISKNMIVPLIFGGDNVAEGAFPWLAAMFVSTGTGYQYKCTANLVSEKHVITAARCVNFYKVQIVLTEEILFVFGKTNLKNWARTGAVTRGASKVEPHPEFNQDSGHGDIMIATLKQPVQFSKTIAPICLWSSTDDSTDAVGKKGTVASWGADEAAQKAGEFNVLVAKYIDMPIVSDDDCIFSNLSYLSYTSDMTFCAGERDGTGTCIGDNGAGFMITNKEKYYLKGLASVLLTDGDGKCDLSFYMIFCDVAKFADWINDAMTKSN